MEQLTKNQAVATSQEAVQNQNEPQLRDENPHNDKSVHGVLNPTHQAGLRRDAVQADIEAERKKREDRKSSSAGMPRPISYAVFCLKKKKITRQTASSRACPRGTLSRGFAPRPRTSSLSFHTPCGRLQDHSILKHFNCLVNSIPYPQS